MQTWTLVAHGNPSATLNSQYTISRFRSFLGNVELAVGDSYLATVDWLRRHEGFSEEPSQPEDRIPAP